MPIKYLIMPQRFSITTVAITRETEACVFYWSDFCGQVRRESKRSSSRVWLDTWEEAHAELIYHATRELAQAEDQLGRAELHLAEVLAMSDPEEDS